LVELAARNRIGVKLGVEPDEARDLKTGQPVKLRLVDSAGAPLRGTIRTIGERVDPQSRLVDVFVALPAGASVLLDSFVTAELEHRSSENSLIVPRNAALPWEEGNADEYELFTTKD